jgi:hypothetical protein
MQAAPDYLEDLIQGGSDAQAEDHPSDPMAPLAPRQGAARREEWEDGA